MTPTYLLFSLAGGWMTGGGTYSSDVSLAAKFDRNTALRMVRSHFNLRLPGLSVVPVLLDDVQEFMGK